MEYKHFSHHHTLTISRVEEKAGQQFICHGCNLTCHGSIFACWKCNFFLHEHCGNANRYIKHPSHSLHPLVLMPSPTYCSGSFLCNGCGATGSTFCYCCPLCEIDLHVQCAYLPPIVTQNSHHHHELHLSFTSPEKQNSSFDYYYCKICKKELSSKHWSYFCERIDQCDFRVHTSCATTDVKPGFYQGNDQVTTTSTTADTTRTEGLTEEEEVMLQISRMRMEFEMTQALANIIAYYPN